MINAVLMIVIPENSTPQASRVCGGLIVGLLCEESVTRSLVANATLTGGGRMRRSRACEGAAGDPRLPLVPGVGKIIGLQSWNRSLTLRDTTAEDAELLTLIRRLFASRSTQASRSVELALL